MLLLLKVCEPWVRVPVPSPTSDHIRLCQADSANLGIHSTGPVLHSTILHCLKLVRNLIVVMHATNYRA